MAVVVVLGLDDVGCTGCGARIALESRSMTGEGVIVEVCGIGIALDGEEASDEGVLTKGLESEVLSDDAGELLIVSLEFSNSRTRGCVLSCARIGLG